jgi:hypothetical protein
MNLKRTECRTPSTVPGWRMKQQPGLLVVQKMMLGLGTAVAVNGRYVAVIAADVEDLKEAFEKLQPGEDFRLAHTDKVGYVRLDMAYPLSAVDMPPLVAQADEHCSLARWFEEEGWDQLQPDLPTDLLAELAWKEEQEALGEAPEEKLAEWFQRSGRWQLHPKFA